MKTLLTVLLLITAISSCTIQKRLYTGGWNVQWKQHNGLSEQTSSAKQLSDVTTSIGETVILPIEMTAIPSPGELSKSQQAEQKMNLIADSEFPTDATPFKENESVKPTETVKVQTNPEKEQLPVSPAARVANIFGITGLLVLAAIALLLILWLTSVASEAALYVCLYLLFIGLSSTILTIYYLHQDKKLRINNPGTYRKPQSGDWIAGHVFLYIINTTATLVTAIRSILLY